MASERVVQAALPLEAAGGPKVEPRRVAGAAGPGPHVLAFWAGDAARGRKLGEATCPHGAGTPEREGWLMGYRQAARLLGGGFSDAGRP